MKALSRPREEIHAAFGRILGPTTRLAVTGATGWLGAAMAHMAVAAGLTSSNGRLRLFASRDGVLPLENGQAEPLERLSGATPLTGESWIVVHFAGLGKERTVGLTPQEFRDESASILQSVQALIGDAPGTRLIFASSGAVYGPDGAPPALELEPYGHVKGMQEAELTNWSGARAIPLTVCRVFNVGGPYGNKLNLYALSSLVQAALGEGPITIQARGPVLRSYVHVEELMAALVGHVQAARPGLVEPFDTAGPVVVEIGDLAEVVCARLGADQDRIVRDFDPARSASRYVGDGQVYQTLLGQLGLSPIELDVIVDDTAHSLKPGLPASPQA